VALARLLADDAGKTVSYEFVASHLWQAFERYDIQKLAFDRWNFKHLLPWLLRAGFSEQFVKDHFVASLSLARGCRACREVSRHFRTFDLG
jgi:hypothetical protein